MIIGSIAFVVATGKLAISLIVRLSCARADFCGLAPWNVSRDRRSATPGAASGGQGRLVEVVWRRKSREARGSRRQAPQDPSRVRDFVEVTTLSLLTTDTEVEGWAGHASKHLVGQSPLIDSSCPRREFHRAPISLLSSQVRLSGSRGELEARLGRWALVLLLGVGKSSLG
jgi:hypothetical protein